MRATGEKPDPVGPLGMAGERSDDRNVRGGVAGGAHESVDTGAPAPRLGKASECDDPGGSSRTCERGTRGCEVRHEWQRTSKAIPQGKSPHDLNERIVITDLCDILGTSSATGLNKAPAWPHVVKAIRAAVSMIEGYAVWPEHEKRTEGARNDEREEKGEEDQTSAPADDGDQRGICGTRGNGSGRTGGVLPGDLGVGGGERHSVTAPNAGVVHASWPNCGVPGPFSERRGEVTCRNCPLPAPTRVATPPSVPAGWVEDFSYRHALSENATLELHDLVDEATDTPSAAHVYECDLVDCARPATVEADDGRSLCDVHGRAAPSSCVAHDPGHPHLIDGEFQSDKYPTCPRGKVPLSTGDLTAQDLLWAYAQRRRVVDAEFADDLEKALRAKGYEPPTESRSVARLAQACELLARAHAILENDPMLEKLPGQIADFLWGSDEAGKAGGVK